MKRRTKASPTDCDNLSSSRCQLELTKKVDSLRKRVADLQALPGREIDSDESLLEAFEELSVALEELSVSEEELIEMNEELMVARAVVEEERERYIDLFERAPDGYLVTTRTGGIREANRAACALLGLRGDHLVGKPLMLYVAKEHRKLFSAQLNRLKHLEGIEDWELKFEPRKSKPFYASIHVTAVPETGETEPALRWLIRDITRRKQAEEALRESEDQLRHLSKQLIRIQEEERKRIAGELHDSIGQLLSAIKFGVENVLFRSPQEAEGLQEIESLKRVVSLVQTTIEEVRRLYTGLRPSLLDDMGIVATIGWFCREFGQIYTNLDVETCVEVGESEVPEVLKTVIFRVMQEALENVARHSHATRVSLSLCRRGDSIRFTVQDNGSGFEDLPPERVYRKGVGLSSMRERVELSGGDFSITFSNGGGTTLQAIWPLEGVSSEE